MSRCPHPCLVARSFPFRLSASGDRPCGGHAHGLDATTSRAQPPRRNAMERHLGIDAHATSCTMCVMSQAGKRWTPEFGLASNVCSGSEAVTAAESVTRVPCVSPWSCYKRLRRAILTLVLGVRATGEESVSPDICKPSYTTSADSSQLFSGPMASWVRLANVSACRENGRGG